MNREAIIRPAHPSERQALEALQRRASLANEGDREALLSNPDAISLPEEQIIAGHVFVCELKEDAGEKIAGFAALLARPDRNFELDGLFVEPGLWRGGIGRMLVDYCAGVARGHGAASLHVIGNPHAERFYQRNGFVAAGTMDTRFGVGLLMQKAL